MNEVMVVTGPVPVVVHCWRDADPGPVGFMVTQRSPPAMAIPPGWCPVEPKVTNELKTGRVLVGVTVAVAVWVAVAVGVSVQVGVLVIVGVSVIVEVEVVVALAVGLKVEEKVAVWVGAGVFVDVPVGVSEAVGVWEAVTLRVKVALSAKVAVGDEVGVSMGPIGVEGLFFFWHPARAKPNADTHTRSLAFLFIVCPFRLSRIEIVEGGMLPVGETR